ncbi:MAG TPA: hypothetical protein VG308_14195 [Stellaceae bacterium]|jgi:hypothetical protein|nr:hypothetical protein [Stellaceae bacterium]
MHRFPAPPLAAGLVFLALLAPARAEPDAAVPGKISEQIVADLARADLDAVSGKTAKYMGAHAAEGIKNSFAAIRDLGQSQYSELVYSRDYGQSEKDIIYKIDFDKAFAYVRLLWHIDNGNWHLVHLNYKTENDLPFPAGWDHIYPK